MASRDEQILGPLKKLLGNVLNNSHSMTPEEYKKTTTTLLQQLLKKCEELIETNDILESRIDELNEECIQKDEDFVRMSQEIQESANQTSSMAEDNQRDLMLQIDYYSEQKYQLENLIVKIQKENSKLKKENQLLRFAGGLPTLSSKLIDLQRERDEYRADVQRLFEETDFIKSLREVELETCVRALEAFRAKFKELKGEV